MIAEQRLRGQQGVRGAELWFLHHEFEVAMVDVAVHFLWPEAMWNDTYLDHTMDMRPPGRGSQARMLSPRNHCLAQSRWGCALAS